MFTKLLPITLTLTICVNCLNVNTNGQLNNKNAERAGSFGNQNRGLYGEGVTPAAQSREQTVIVVPNGGSSVPHKTVPTSYQAKRFPTVIVNGPDQTNGINRAY